MVSGNFAISAKLELFELVISDKFGILGEFHSWLFLILEIGRWV